MQLLRGLVFAMLGVLPAACRTPPDVGPFSEASFALRASIVQTGASYQNEIARICGEQDLEARFRAAWAPRETVAGAIDAYARALVEVVGSAENSAARAREVFDGAHTLVSAAAGAFPGGDAAADAARAGFAAIAERYINHRAATTVDRAVHDADPMIRDVAGVFGEDLDALRGTLRTMHADAEIRLRSPYLTGDERPLSVLQTLERRARGLSKAIAGLPDNAEDDGSRRESVLLYKEEIDLIRQAIDMERSAPWHADYQRDLAALNARFAHLDSSLASARRLLDEWARAHGDLIEAAASGRTPDARMLLLLTEELWGAYRTFEGARR
jgi:hypothetical protein